MVDEPAAEEPALSAPAATPVTLTWHVGGESPVDEAYVETTLNSLPQVQELGVQIDLVFTPWDVYPEALFTTILAGSACDLAYLSQELNNHPKMVNQELLLPLDDLINNYAPEIFMRVPRPAWDLARVNGLVYAVPHLTGWSAPQGILIDQTIVDKYQIDINQAGSLVGMEIMTKS